MSDYPRYTRIKEEMHKELQAKTGWGRNELETVLASVLNRVADEEINWLKAQQVYVPELVKYETSKLISDKEAPL